MRHTLAPIGGVVADFLRQQPGIEDVRTLGQDFDPMPSADFRQLVIGEISCAQFGFAPLQPRDFRANAGEFVRRAEIEHLEPPVLGMFMFTLARQG